MSDIVERLRSHDDCLLQPIRRDAKEAADEIERLRVENARLHARVTEYFCEPATHPVEREE